MDTKSLQPRTRTTTSDDCPPKSPEFEFWMVRNPSCPQPDILSADELFVDGVLLPLHLVSSKTQIHNTDTQQTSTSSSQPDPPPPPEPSASITDSSPAAATLSSSKRWRDIFRKSSEKKNSENNNSAQENDNEKDKAKKKDRKGGASTASAAELNINIWPFSRSRSAGNAVTRPKLFPGAPVTRKTNSAPCSRSNSAGESKSRKWPNSPGRGGVHLGRSSPVWQVRRGGSTSKNTEPLFLNHEKWSKRETSTVGRRSKVSSSGGEGGKARVLNINVPTCIGYRTHLSCRSDVMNSAVGSNSTVRPSNGNGNSNGADGGNVGSKLFNLRSLFKKTLLTSH
ncbi:hypothetical protein HN51_002824 [Arachis hypogaea]|uniref:Uncharacterized protein n=2 Tax=Arachis TaxID=3817 RepID=A0A445EL94_ARAHY|nr:uncharacterized protein LOC107466410 [Arachis duranensis]XP_025612915.1 uncharacterized protein LOC112706041 [Arachis hypogaea]QHO51069.1 uncharacterized protein DS421_1g27710 [Arachis hypogaea]RYR76151.1 hypothetical protein Ahy_A01g000751 [Arachis hypogaea]